MKKDNLVKRLGKKVLPYFLAGSLSLGSLLNYRCSVSESPDSQKPVAVLSAQPKEGYVPLSVNFDGSQSYDRDGSIQEYIWDFGDGKTDTTTSAFTNYLYENGGEYSAGLVVVDNKGQKSNKALERILVNDDIVPLGEIAFYKMIKRPDPSTKYNEDIWTGEIIIKNNEIKLENLKQITYHGGSFESSQYLYPSWSPDGNQIAFQTNRNGPFEVYIIDADGSNLRKLIEELPEEGFRSMNPTWHPDGNKIIFTYYDNLTLGGIARVNIDGTDFTSLYEGGSLPRGPPSYSPDGFKIAFDYTREVFSMNADGSKVENLTNHPSTDGQPRWLPDDSGIVFSSARGDPNNFIYHLWLMDLDGINPRMLTNSTFGELDAAISSDKKYLVFSKRMYEPLYSGDNQFQLYFTEFENAFDESKWIQLTFDGRLNRFPIWKPKIND